MTILTVRSGYEESESCPIPIDPTVSSPNSVNNNATKTSKTTSKSKSVAKRSKQITKPPPKEKKPKKMELLDLNSSINNTKLLKKIMSTVLNCEDDANNATTAQQQIPRVTGPKKQTAANPKGRKGTNPKRKKQQQLTTNPNKKGKQTSSNENLIMQQNLGDSYDNDSNFLLTADSSELDILPLTSQFASLSWDDKHSPPSISKKCSTPEPVVATFSHNPLETLVNML